MLGCGCALVSYLLTVTLLLSASDGLRATPVASKCPDSGAVEDSRSWRQTGESSASRPTGRLPPLEHAGSATESRRRRTFPGANAPLDRLSVGRMDMRGKKRKEVESVRRRLSPPIDRIGMGRLPSSRQG
ncbi:osteocrin-like [Conger conger]|uniref:osteocrin-like n=1 Tax=Conger conger TaxID=82655 RepID=UPI002A5ABB4A|nr:osteocrin-like [Conger conger]